MNENIILYVINDPAFFLSHRLPLAQEASRAMNARIALVSAPATPRDAEKLKEYGITHHSLPIRRITTNPIHLLVALNRLVRIILKIKPILVHAIAMKAFLLCASASVFCRKPCYVYLVTGLGFIFTHNCTRHRFMQKLVLGFLRFSFFLSHIMRRMVVVQNEDDSLILARAGIENIAIIAGSGVDVAAITPTPIAQTSPPMVLMASRLLRSKGIEDFAAAAELLKRQKIPAHFVLAGDLRPDSPDGLNADIIQHWQRKRIVEWVGHVGDIDAWIARASVICYPSWYREGIPRFLLEAAAHGRPIVTTDHPGCRHAIEHGKSGFLVPIRDPQALVDALTMLLLNPLRLQTMGTAARKRAEEKFSLASVNAKTIKIYQSLLNVSR